MMLKLLAAAAALLVPAAAQAQAQDWYLIGAAGDGSALMFIDRTSVRVDGDQATAMTLLVKVAEPPATAATIRFDCGKHVFRIVTGQQLDIDAKPIGGMITGDGTAINVGPGTFFEDAETFICGGSANPDPQLRIGDKPPVRAGIEYLRDKQSGAK